MTAAPAAGILALRAGWCAPGEPIRWCTREGSWTAHHEVPGLRADGRPADGVGRRLARGAAVGLLGAVDAATGGGSPEGGARADAPALIVFGTAPDCAAVALIASTATAPPGFWVLTDRRLAYVTRVAEPVPEPARPRSLLGRVAGFARDLGEAFTDRPEHPPGRPVPVAAVRTLVEIPGSDLTPGGVYRRSMRGHAEKQPAYERLTLHDGSGLDFYAGNRAGPLPDRLTTRLVTID